MNKIFLSILTISAFTIQSNAQSIKKCASFEIVKQIEAQAPGYSQKLNEIGNENSNNKTRGNIIYIPVVVHIVYKNSTENLTDNYISGQINLLNKSYARENSDTTNMRSAFSSIAGKTDIRFVLAQIIRVPTTVQGFEFSTTWGGGILADDVKLTNNGGSNAVLPSKNLNLWVCDLTIPGGVGELLGYAYPPPGLPNWSAGSAYSSVNLDGVVIDYLAFGGTGKLPLGSSFGLKGKTAVHEVGHYLGLRHIWGDDGGACQGDFDFEDDGITDTPHADDASGSDCDKTKNTCNQGSGDLPDMVENYMDYSDEACQNTFTKGQATFMYNVLTNVRTGIRVPTGIEEEKLSTLINIFPNPVSESIAIQFNDLDFQNAVIEIKDITGKIIKSETITSKTNSYVISGLSKFQNGIYIATININNYRINKTFLINN